MMAIVASEVATGWPLMARMVSPAASPARSAGPALRTAEATTWPSRVARRSPSQPLGGCGTGATVGCGAGRGAGAVAGWGSSAAAAGAATYRVAARARRAERGIGRGMRDELW